MAAAAAVPLRLLLLLLLLLLLMLCSERDESRLIFTDEGVITVISTFINRRRPADAGIDAEMRKIIPELMMSDWESFLELMRFDFEV